MSSNLISIVVPVYNIAKYLERCVISVQAQTYGNIEILLVDNGSTDGSSELVDKLAQTDDRIVALHRENKGVTYARIEGVKASKGDWIGFVDGDDYIEPHMYERLLNNAITYDAQISHCGYKMVFPRRVDYYYNTGEIALQDNITGLKDLLSGIFVEPGLCNKMYKRELLDEFLNSNLMDFSIRNNEDLLMNYYLFKSSLYSIYEDFCPYHYLKRNDSASTAKVNEHKLRDPLKVRKIIRDDCSCDEVSGIINSSILYYLIGLSTYTYGENKTLVKPYVKSARKELRRDLKRYLFGNYSMKLKISALWVAIWPSSYKFVHYVYEKATGLDKKYEVR